MKKIASIALMAVLILSMSACGRKNKQTEPTTTTTVPPTTFATTPSTSPTTDTILPAIPDPSMDTLLPDSGLLDTGDGMDDNMGTSGSAMN